MKKNIKTIAVVAALSGFVVATHADTVVWSQNFDSLSTGAYGAHTTDFGGSAHPTNTIVTPGDGGIGNAMSVTFFTTNGITVNFQTATLATAPSGATSSSLSDYVLSFDMAIEGVDISAGYGGLQVSLQGNDGGIFGVGEVSPFIIPPGGTAGSGYQHYSYNLSTFTASSGGALNLSTASTLAFGIGVVAYGNGMDASPETFLVDNIQVTMIPEPTSLALMGCGAALFFVRRSKKN